MLAQQRSDKYINYSFSTVVFEVFQSLKCNEKQIQKRKTYSVPTNLTLHAISSSVEIAHSQKIAKQSNNYKCRLQTLSDGSIACIRLFPFYRLEMQRTCKCGLLMNEYTSEQSSTPYCVRSDKFLRTKSDNFQKVFDLLTLCSSS